MKGWDNAKTEPLSPKAFDRIREELKRDPVDVPPDLFLTRALIEAMSDKLIRSISRCHWRIIGDRAALEEFNRRLEGL